MGKTANGFNATGAQFVLTELDLAITFCEVALTTSDSYRVGRNAENAQRALNAASRFQHRVRLRPDEQQQVTEKTSHLQSLLHRLNGSESSADQP